VLKSLVEGSTCSVGGGKENITVDSNGGSELGGAMESLLGDASTNLALCLLPSKKIYKTHKKTLKIIYLKMEFEIAQVDHGESLPSCPS
jgi:hypothetical protein